MLSSPVREPVRTDLPSAESQLEMLLGVCASLNQTRPVEQLLDDLLHELRRLVNAEAGAVYIADAERLKFVCAQNDARPDLVQCGKTSLAHKNSILKEVSVPLDAPTLGCYVTRTGEALNIPDVYNLPPVAPYRFDPTIDTKTGYRCQSMLVIPLVVGGSKPIGAIQAINHKLQTGGIGAFPGSTMEMAKGLASMATMLLKNAQLRAQIHKLHLDTIFRLATAAEFRDTDTGAHIRRVSMYCETIARAMGLPQAQCHEILFAAPMHDVGKLGVPDAILTKPGPLTPEERTTMQQHTLMGSKILSGSDNEVLRCAEQIAIAHHEKWDGTGYPNGLKGPDIPLVGRICAVADVFDALTSKRAYKPPFPLEKAFEIIRKDAGTHFDHDVVAAFERERETVESIYLAYKED